MPQKHYYRVLKDNDSRKLESLVNELLEEGWALVGGISIACNENGFQNEVTFAQAMIKERKYD